MTQAQHDVLTAAARAALTAPSLLNTQPWVWHLHADSLDLRADRDRQARVADPEGHLLVLSCGIALHHACVAIAASGHTPVVRRFVRDDDDDLLARVMVGAPREVELADEALFEAMSRRRTDRRPFRDEGVPESAVDAIRTAVEDAGASLHQVRRDQMPMLAVAVGQAGATEMSEPEYRVELMRWTNRPQWSGDGVPATATVQRAPRRVPMRDLTFDPQAGMPTAAGGDHGAAYLVVFGAGDEAADWFQAGEATSAAMLTATALDLAVAPISDVIEVEHPRALVRGLLNGIGYPYLVLRCGWPTARGDLVTVPRRAPQEAIVGLTDQ